MNNNVERLKKLLSNRTPLPTVTIKTENNTYPSVVVLGVDLSNDNKVFVSVLDEGSDKFFKIAFAEIIAVS